MSDNNNNATNAPAAPTHHKGALVGSAGGLKEGLFGFACGLVYGITSPIVGHPLDTIKTKMQAQTQYMTGNSFTTLQNIVKNEGVRGLWRGVIPPIIGSSIFRSVQFGAYGIAYGYLKDYESMTTEIPYTGGLQPRVLVGGLFSAFIRSLIETPLELIKVRRQTGQTWRVGNAPLTSVKGWRELLSLQQAQELYKGYGITFIRTWGLMGSFFILVDYMVRKMPTVINAPVVGPFIKGGVNSTLAWLIVWPLEFIKSQVQANTILGNTANLSVLQRMKHVLREHGFVGLYRGIGPGASRALIANGCSMVAYSYCQTLRHHFEAKQHESFTKE